MGRLAEKDSAARRERQLSSAPNPADFSEALARGMAVLSAFGETRRRVTQAELARELDLSRATVRRIVITLEHLGFLVADGRTYELTPRVLRLASSYLTSNPASVIAQPVCERICASVGEACSVAVLDGSDAVMVARAVPNQLLEAGTGIGFRTPAAISSLGKVLLAHLPDDVRAATLAELADAPSTEVLDRIRADGYCYVADEIEVGSHSVAVPVRRWDGRVIAAMHVGCRIERISKEDMCGRVLCVLLEAADELHEQLI
ncbi:transcriptional regulator, IclR family [Pseudonocardia thermophila]|jgi:Transcriptional regulator|uniref:Transcriptional regulator, IclR family n=1 Tax=Pseudonocardia thermophila TaxID=1848 RepID=A0A1M6XI68_PSETH|nr:IclR family transcriptional regulator C-terminal domain-containing protein [Pseudonocardia thermophila]SHL05667.1 transcriptional regulator, IclR family [Pseudonocardia thermophila]